MTTKTTRTKSSVGALFELLAERYIATLWAAKLICASAVNRKHNRTKHLGHDLPYSAATTKGN